MHSRRSSTGLIGLLFYQSINLAWMWLSKFANASPPYYQTPPGTPFDYVFNGGIAGVSTITLPAIVDDENNFVLVDIITTNDDTFETTTAFTMQGSDGND